MVYPPVAPFAIVPTLDCFQALADNTLYFCGQRIGQLMPEVSRFFGIIIRMYVETGGGLHNAITFDD